MQLENAALAPSQLIHLLCGQDFWGRKVFKPWFGTITWRCCRQTEVNQRGWVGWGWFETKWSHDLPAAAVISTQQSTPVTPFFKSPTEGWKGQEVIETLRWKDRIGLFTETAKSFWIWFEETKLKQNLPPNLKTTSTLKHWSTLLSHHQH